MSEEELWRKVKHLEALLANLEITSCRHTLHAQGGDWEIGDRQLASWQEASPQTQYVRARRGVLEALGNFLLRTAPTGARLEIRGDGLYLYDADDNVVFYLDADTGASSLDDVQIDESQIDHNLLKNYVAAEHIDWTDTDYSLLTSGDVTAANLTATEMAAGYVMADEDGLLSGGHEAGGVILYPDKAAGGYYDDEFTSTTLSSSWTKTSTAAEESYHGTWPSHAYTLLGNSQSWKITKNIATPSGEFTIGACFRMALVMNNQECTVGICNSDESRIIRIKVNYASGGLHTTHYYYTGSWVKALDLTLPTTHRVYLRLKRASDGKWYSYFSLDGHAYQGLGAGQSLDFTPHHVEVRMSQEGATTPIETGCDWFRATGIPTP